jgi:hypothetical protein
LYRWQVGPSVSLVRVAALVAGLSLVEAFFMPWFGSQGLLLSGQFLHNFLTGASPSELRRFLPNSSSSEVQLLRMLVDLFPMCGAVAAAAVLLGGLSFSARRLANIVWGLSGLIPLVAWAVGIGRLPAGSTLEIGLWLIGGSALIVILGLVLELWASRASV